VIVMMKVKLRLSLRVKMMNMVAMITLKQRMKVKVIMLDMVLKKENLMKI